MDLSKTYEYINSVIFYAELRKKDELFSWMATIYHENMNSIKRYLDNLKVRNGLEILSVKYKKNKDGIMRNYKYE